MSSRSIALWTTILGLGWVPVVTAAPVETAVADETEASTPEADPEAGPNEGSERAEVEVEADGDPAAAAATEAAPVVASAPAESKTVSVGPEGVVGPAPEVAAVPEPAKKDDCREGASPLVPKGELDLVCPHEVDPASITFKPGTGLVFTSKDGRFSLAPRLRAQLLYTIQNDNEADATTQGLEIRRARLQFKGHFFNKNNKFKTELALSPRDQGFDGAPHHTPILDWYFDFTYLKSLSLRVGQYKVPYSRQRVVSSGDLELVDRALSQGEFNLDRDIGLDLRSKDFLGLDKLRYYAGVWMGEGRDYRATDTFEFMYIGRVEVLPFGQFEDYEEADFERTRKPRLSLGAAYSFVDAAKNDRGVLGSKPSDGGTTDMHNATGDFMFKIVGVSATGEVYWRQGRREFGSATVIDDLGNEVAAERERPRDGMGWFLQAGYLIPRVPLQIAGRYSQTRRLDSSTSSLPNRDEVGGGLSWYFAHHPLKLQLDYFRVWEENELAMGTDRVRLQLQAAF